MDSPITGRPGMGKLISIDALGKLDESIALDFKAGFFSKTNVLKDLTCFAAIMARASAFADNGFFLTAAFGPGLVSKKSMDLGTIFQTFSSVGFGIQDAEGFKIGIEWFHISNGKEYVNFGRDFLMISITESLNFNDRP